MKQQKRLISPTSQCEFLLDVVTDESKTVPKHQINWTFSEGNEQKGIRLISTGTLLSVEGSCKTWITSSGYRSVPFKISLENAKSLKLVDVDITTKTLNNGGGSDNSIVLDDLASSFKCYQAFTIIASGFEHSDAPVKDMHLTFVLGCRMSSTGHIDEKDPPVLLCRGLVNPLAPPAQGEYHLKEYTLNRIVLLTADVAMIASVGDAVPPPKAVLLVDHPDDKDGAVLIDRDPSWLQLLITTIKHALVLFIVAAILWDPAAVSQWPQYVISSAISPEFYDVMLNNSGDRQGPGAWYHILDVFAYAHFLLLWLVRILLVLFACVLMFITPLRRDFLSDFGVYMYSYLRWQMGYQTEKGTGHLGLTFFIHGWQAWSYCGALPQGSIFPLYGMPHPFVKAFHDGGAGMEINLGKGTDVSSMSTRTPTTPLSAASTTATSTSTTLSGLGQGLGQHKQGSVCRRDYVSSDLFTVLANTHTQQGVIGGFLSQRHQFNCLAVNRDYSHMSVHVDCDGVVVARGSPIDAKDKAVTMKPDQKADKNPPIVNHKTATVPPASLRTDWFSIQLQNHLKDDPFGDYLDLAGAYNQVHKMYNDHHSSLKNDNVGGDNGSIGGRVGVDSDSSGSGGGSASGSGVNNMVPAGWCSWYHFFEKVSEKDLTDNIRSMQALKNENGLKADRLGFSLFQIDDGYQRAWGDWLLLDMERFPSQCMNVIVNQVEKAKMTPGLWMAPFACDKHSKLAADHPSWILSKSKDVPSNSANCGKWFYGLDVTNPEVQCHIQDCIAHATVQWGFRYLKLDFLYVAALSDSHQSYHDRTLTRAQAMQLGLSTVTTAMGPNVFLLGCGAPIGSAIGRVHANRVSADAGLSWLPGFPLPFYDKWNLPCARNMVRNSLCRMTMHGRWWINDPDCMLLRAALEFTEEEIVGIATVKALSGGSFVMSDDIGAVPPHRLRIAQQLLPATNHAAVPLDLLEREMPQLLRLCLPTPSSSSSDGTGLLGHGCLHPWALMALCNWRDYPQSLCFDVKSTLLVPNDNDDETSSSTTATTTTTTTTQSPSVEKHILLHMFEFWSGEYTPHHITINDGIGKSNIDDQGHIIRTVPVAVHSAKIYAIRRLQMGSGVAQYLGSNLHFSCGLEVKQCTVIATSGDTRGPAACKHSCTLEFEPGALREESWGGFVWVYLSHSGIEPTVLGSKGAQGAMKVTDIEMPESFHTNDGGGNSKGGNSKGTRSTTAAAAAAAAAGTSVLGAVWKIAVCRGHNPVAKMDDALLIYW